MDKRSGRVDETKGVIQKRSEKRTSNEPERAENQAKNPLAGAQPRAGPGIRPAAGGPLSVVGGNGKLATDEEIDELVYELYGITNEERKIIERSL